jgi:hypothetical protein
MGNTEEIIAAITEQVKKLNGKDFADFSGDTLSRISVRLAAYKAGLGEHVDRAKKDALIAEKLFKEAKAKEFQRLRDSGKSATDAQELKLLNVGKEYMDYIEAQCLADSVNSLSYNIHDLIDSIKSRTINLQMEKVESNVY